MKTPCVILNQCTNFLRFLDCCRIVLHVSQTATFSKLELQKELKDKKIEGRVVINPQSVDTGWGNIIRAHIENIKYILKEDSNSNGKIAFHASNDMLIRSGLKEFMAANNRCYHIRIYDREGYWWPAREALRDEELNEMLCYVNGNSRIIGSQIEGSFYQIQDLAEIVPIIEKFYTGKNRELFYTREEFYFSSLCYAAHLEPSCTPYVFSEVHRYDRGLWSLNSPVPVRRNGESTLGRAISAPILAML